VPAAKSQRVAERKRQRIRPIRSKAKTFVRKARLSIDSGDSEVAEAATMQAIVALDKAAQKGALHKRNAARRKSRLMRHLNTAKA
jgi:small subunit ribosomal protein S20